MVERIIFHVDANSAFLSWSAAYGVMVLDETVDALRDKYGEDILRRGKFAQDPGAHIAGGLDKARRTDITKPVPDEF